MKAEFSFIHLSDLHLSLVPSRRNLFNYSLKRIDIIKDDWAKGKKKRDLIYPATYNPEVLSAVARFCNDWHDAVDGIILTGDLCTTGMATDLGTGVEFLCTSARAGMLTAKNVPTISSFSSEVVLLPGNHDRYANNWGWPNSVAFDLQFVDFIPNFVQRVGHTVYEKNGLCLGIIIADFCLRKVSDAIPSGHYGQGKVYDDTLSRLDAVTKGIRSKHKDCQIVWMVHFAPYDCGVLLELRDYKKLRDLADQLDVKYMMCGHTHVRRKEVWSNLTIYCAASSSGIDSFPSNEVHLINFDVTASSISARRQSFTWDEREQAFSEVFISD